MLKKYQKIISYINWLIKGKPVPPPDFIKEKIIKKYAFRFSPKVFIETGTYYGDKIDALKHLFVKIISIELDKELYEKTKQRFKNYSNIEIIQGDSSEILPKIDYKSKTKQGDNFVIKHGKIEEGIVDEQVFGVETGNLLKYIDIKPHIMVL